MHPKALFHFSAGGGGAIPRSQAAPARRAASTARGATSGTEQNQIFNFYLAAASSVQEVSEVSPIESS